MRNALFVTLSVLSFAIGITVAQRHTNELPFTAVEKPILVTDAASSLIRGRVYTVDTEHNTIIFATPDRFDPRKENFYKLILSTSTTIENTATAEAQVSALAQRITSTMLDKKIRISIKNSENALHATMISVPRIVNL